MRDRGRVNSWPISLSLSKVILHIGTTMDVRLLGGVSHSSIQSCRPGSENTVEHTKYSVHGLAITRYNQTCGRDTCM